VSQSQLGWQFSKATVREVREEFNNANNQKILQTSNQAFHKDYTKKNRPSCWFLGDIVSYCVCARQYIVRRFDNQSEVDDNIIYSDCFPLAYSSYFLERDESSDFRAATLFAIWILFISVSMLQRLM